MGSTAGRRGQQKGEQRRGEEEARTGYHYGQLGFVLLGALGDSVGHTLRDPSHHAHGSFSGGGEEEAVPFFCFPSSWWLIKSSPCVDIWERGGS